MVKKVISILIILAIVFSGGFYTAKQLIPTETETNTGPIYATQPVERGDIHVGVNTSGQLNASYGGGIRVPEVNDRDLWDITYTIEEFLAEEGDAIKEGENVVKLSSMNLDDKIEQLETQLDSKKDYLAQMMGIEKSEIDSVNPYDGIVIRSPIAGRITELNAVEGKELEGLIAKVVDDSKYNVSFKATESEYEEISKDQKVFLKFEDFEGYYEGTITKINTNAIPNNEGDFGTTYVHWGEIFGINPGLIQPGMNVSINLADGDKIGTKLTFKAKVDSYANEESIFKNAISSEDIVVTKLLVSEQSYVEKGDAIVELAGAEVRMMIQNKIDELKELKRSVEKAYTLKDNMFVKAPMNGIVAGFWRQKKEEIRAGDWIGDVYNTNEMRIWAQVDDLDIVYIKQGSPVVVTIDALPGDEFEGEVTRVSQSKDRDGLIRYNVDIRVSGSEELRPGMQANCFVDAGQSEDTLLIPIESVFEEDGITKVEILKEDNTTEKLSIEVGLMNDRYVEVISGLEEGQLVITGSSSDLLPSQHIKSNDTILPDTGNESE